MLAHRKGSTNLVKHSETFTDALWVSYRVNAITKTENAPDRTTNGSSLVPNTASSNAHNIKQNVIGRTTGQDYVYSVFGAANGYSGLTIIVDNTTGLGDSCGFNLANGTIVGSSAGIIDAKIESYYNSYYRCSIKHNFTNTDLAFYIICGDIQFMGVDGKFTGFAGNGTSGIKIFGAQCQLDELTDYIPTTTSAVTVNPDTYTIPYASNFYSDYGIILCRFTPRVAVTGTNGLLSYIGTANNTVLWRDVSGVFKTYDSTQTTSHTATYVPGDDVLVALCYVASSNQVSVMTSVNAASFTSTDGTYDGTYANSNTYLHLALDGSSVDFRSIQAYHTGLTTMTLTEMKSWVTANAHTKTT